MSFVDPWEGDDGEGRVSNCDSDRLQCGPSRGHSRRRADQDPQDRTLLPTGLWETGHQLQECLKKNKGG